MILQIDSCCQERNRKSKKREVETAPDHALNRHPHVNIILIMHATIYQALRGYWTRTPQKPAGACPHRVTGLMQWQ